MDRANAAEELEELNDNIVGFTEVIGEHRAQAPHLCVQEKS
jgi:hypothetical protein